MNKEVLENNVVGKRVPIRDASLKVSGKLRYVGDIKLPHMLYAKILFSPLPHAKIKHIDTREAEALPGVHAVVCYKDAPKERYNGNGEDKDFYKTERIFDDRVRFVGDKVAAVAAETLEIAKKAIKLIKVEYEELPFYLEASEALKEESYPIHEGGNLIEKVNMGCNDVEVAMEGADFVFEDTYYMPAVHHSAIETHVSIADYDFDGKLTVYTPTQDVFGQRENLRRIFGIPMNKLRVVASAIGGGFGGKIDLITEPIAALLAIKTQRPVKLELTRNEDISFSRTRHAMEVTIKTGINKDGLIVAQDVKSLVNAGAHTSCTMSVCWAMGGKLFKLYKTPNLRFKALPVYTNTSIAGAMRGFGSPQLYFAQQAQLASIAKELNLDIINIQLKNLVEPFDYDLGSQLTHGNARPKDCVIKGKEVFGWEKSLLEREKFNNENSRYKMGIGMAAASHGNGIYKVMPDKTSIILKLNEDGSAVLFTGVSDMGSGTITAQLQVVSEVLGIPVARIGCVNTDTETTLWDLGAYSSRGVFVGCQAAKKAAELIKKELELEARQLLGKDMAEFIFRDSKLISEELGVELSIEEVIKHAHEVNERDICCSTTFANCANAMSYGVHFVKVLVDTEEGIVKILDYAASHDIGKAINPMSVEGQIEGAVQMGIGYALKEELVYAEDGRLKTNSLRKYKLVDALEMPKVKLSLIEEFEESGPYGAKSIGECSVVPSVGAIVNAVSDALGKSIHRIPIKPQDIISGELN